MFFLAALIFVSLLYVLPGFLLLDWAAHFVVMPWMPRAGAYWIMATVIYVACLIVVHLGRHAYTELQLDRGKLFIRPFLDARACRWLTAVGITFLSWQFYKMTSRWAMPYQFAPLYGALLLGFLDLRRRPAVLELAEELPGPLFDPAADSDKTEGQDVVLSWEYLAAGGSPEAHVFQVGLTLDQEQVERAAKELMFVPKQPEDYARYVTKGPMDDVRALAAWLRRQSDERKFDSIQEAENIIRMVRSVPYVQDHEQAGDQPKYPIQTLHDLAGDCEDHAILAASLLWQLGHPVALAYLELDGRAHMALAYATESFSGTFCLTGDDGKSYAYVETVPSSMEMGEIPEEFLREMKRATIIPI